MKLYDKSLEMFGLKMEVHMRIDKLFALKNIGSRKEIKQLVKQGIVSVNGKVVKNSNTQVNITCDEVYFGDDLIKYHEKMYIVINKPKGYVSALKDDLHPVVIDLISDEDYQTDLSLVGRLDKDTTGLLITTNDGEFNHFLMSPKHHVEKEYRVSLKNFISDNDISLIENEIALEDGYVCKPATVTRINDLEVFITITEGKFHQVKRMFKAINNEVIDLERVRIGSLILKNLDLGEYRYLTDEEIKNLKTK